jgi:uncharacterized protein YqgV (UPF0045/DUF77 family)
MSTLEAQLLKSINTASATNSLIRSTIAVSSSGDVYVIGGFRGKLDIGNGVTPITTTSTDGSAFVAKYNSTLTPTDLKYIGGPGTNDLSGGYSVAVSSSGDVYVTGMFRGTLDISVEVTPITTNSTYGSAFVAKYTSTLRPTHLKYIGGDMDTDISDGYSVAVSPSGDIYVTGRFRGTLDIGGEVPRITTTSTDGSAFVAKYTSTLIPTILKYIGGTEETDRSIGYSVAVSSSGDVYVTGVFRGTLDIGGGIPRISSNSTGNNAFVAKYTNTLAPTHLKYIGSTEETTIFVRYFVAVSSSGDVYVIGGFRGKLDIGNGVTPITTTSTDVSSFIAKYTSTLTPTILKYIGGDMDTDGSDGGSVAVSSSGDVYVTGGFRGTLDIGGEVPRITTTSTDSSTFVAKYTSTLAPTLLKYIGGTNPNDISIGYSVAFSSSGDVYVTGQFDGTISIDGGKSSITFNGITIDGITIDGSETTNFFLAKYFTMHNEPICLVSGTPILTDQGIVAIENIDTNIHTIGKQRIVAVTKAITPEKSLICFGPNSVAINCPTKKTIMTPGHEVLYKGKLVQAKHFVGKLDGVHTVPYDGKIVYNVLLKQHGVMNVNNMNLETLNPKNIVAKRILNTL